jgi:branched-chain amino acid transport system permease protein
MLITILLGSMISGLLYGGIAIGYSLIYKASGLMSLAQGDMLMIGAFIGLTYTGILKIPFAIAFVLTLITMFVIGLLIEAFLVAKLLEKGSRLAYVMLLTMALALLLQNAAMIIWGSQTFYFPAIFPNTPAFQLTENVYIAPEQILIIAVAIIMMILLVFFLNKTKFGTSMRAAALDQKAASNVGINVPLTKGVTWGIAAAIAGSLGCCQASLMGINTTMGVNFGQKGFASAVVGGYGDIYGAIIGGLLFGFLEQFVTIYISSMYRDVVSFGVLILVLAFMPTGIFKSQVLE